MTTTHKDGDDRVALPQLTAREKVLIRGLRYYHYRNDIRYSQSRPTQIRLPRETTRLDCSGLVAACMDFAGVRPRVDWRYTNTWVQIKFGSPKTLATARPGEVVFYGPGKTNPTHEAMLLGTLEQLRKLITVPSEVVREMRGSGKYVLSMGHYPMGIYPVDYRGDRIQIRDLIGTATSWL
jgi:cell wall-associated NlpC family hydrolase